MMMSDLAKVAYDAWSKALGFDPSKPGYYSILSLPKEQQEAWRQAAIAVFDIAVNTRQKPYEK